MVDITSLKVRLARLRLAGSKSKEVSERIRNRQKPIEEEEEVRTRKAGKDPYNQYTKNPNKRKKNNKLTRSDQKRGSLDAGDGDYTKNTGGKRKKKNKLTRSDQKRGKKQDLVADENKRNTKLQKKKKKKKVTRESDANVSLRERESPGVSQKTWDELDQYPEFMSDPTTD
jgi:hypothetical protein